MLERNISVTTHGRYLIDASAGPGAPVLAGFHGYAESAEHEFRRLCALPGGEAWLRVAVQGLHRFYRGRSEDVVASWMTRQDRALAIEDNRNYVSRVFEAVAEEWSTAPTLVVSGFSQGVGMAFRAAVHATPNIRGIIACGGDVPPELDHKALAVIPSAILGRGINDAWYTEEKLLSDERRLRDAGINVDVVRFAGGHEWPEEFSSAVGHFLDVCRSS